MLSRYCPNCGTEVDEIAVFCPTCGQAVDESVETAMPPAPAWPEPEATDEPPSEPVPDTPAPAPPPPPAASAPSAPADAGGNSTPGGVNVPFTAPLMLSGWLIGGGAALGALGALIGLFDGFVSPVELILLVVLLGVAASVFLATSLPDIAGLRLITLIVVLVAFGVAMDRLSFGGGLATLLLFLGSAAAAIGAVIIELGRDQPLGGA